MRIFVPSTDLGECARVLDNRELCEQRYDCGRVLSTLHSMSLHESGPGVPSGWTSDPFVSAWRGYESALGVYMTLCVAEWERRGLSDNVVSPYSRRTFLRSPGWHRNVLVPDGRDAELPYWWGDERVHSSHKRALMDVNHTHYRQFNWRVLAKTEFYWPIAQAEPTL